jgi:cytochrome c oxidase subunit 4
MIYARVYVILLGLLGLTYGVSFIDLGPGNLLAGLTIAVTKALLIVFYFMHLKTSPKLTRFAALAGILWLSVLMSLTLNDYISRRWHPLPGTWPQEIPDEVGSQGTPS